MENATGYVFVATLSSTLSKTSISNSCPILFAAKSSSALFTSNR